MSQPGWAAAAVAVVSVLPAAGGYGLPESRCGLADPRINESSGVAAASWSPEVIWTHNDSGDVPRFFAVDAKTCATLGVYTVSGAEAVDWEDMARTGTTLHFGDIGDNGKVRPSVAVYDVAEPGQGAADGTVPALARRVLTYPDGAHDAETLLVDPTTSRLVIVTKEAGGVSTVYRAPERGDGVLERVTDVTFRGITMYERLVTGGDATPERLILRTYLAAAEWEVRSGDTLAGALARSPAPVGMPLAPQGEAIGYTTGGDGLWVTSEGEHGPVHRLGRSPAGSDIRPQGVAPEDPAVGDDPVVRDDPVASGDGSGTAVALAGAGAALAGLLVVYALGRRRRSRMAGA